MPVKGCRRSSGLPLFFMKQVQNNNMRIFKSIFLFGWIGLLLSACSPDSVVDTDGIGSGVADNTLITIYFNLPGNATPETRSLLNGAGTRAEGEEYNEQQPGTDTENTVSTVNLILMEATSQNGGSYTYGKIAAVVKDILAEKVEGESQKYRFTTEVLLPAGNYRIFLIANPDNSADEMAQLDNSSMTFDAFKDIQRSCTTLDQLEKQLYTDNRFLMTSEYASDQSDIIECKPGGTATATLRMQRAATRIDYIYNETDENTQKNIFTTDVALYNNLNNKVSIKLTRAALFNISKSFYYFKHISADETADNATIDASATEGNFVIDTDWNSKAASFAPLRAEINESDFPNKELSAFDANNSIVYADVSYKGTQLFYTSENTVPTNAQLKGTCTGVLLKGEFGLDESKQDILNGCTDILVHNHIIYPAEDTGALSELNEALTTEYGKEITITKNTDAATLKTYNVQRFTREDATKPFVTYYPVFMRHRNNNDNNVAGPMEFSVVRNTIYRFRVKSISGLGPDIDPEDPVEKPAQIDIEVSVADWVDRDIVFDI